MILKTISLFIVILCVCRVNTNVIYRNEEPLRHYRSDYPYYLENLGWFNLHHIPETWYDARLRCHLEGAVLASPNNQTLLDAMKNILMHHRKSDFSVFTGIHATISKGDFSSIEGVPLSKIPVTWAQGEPNDNNHLEQCIVMSGDGTMADVKCDATYRYMCYKEDTGNLNECGTFDNRYQLNSRTGNCYKFHNKAKNWERAYMTCSAEGGYLAIVNDEAEQVLFKDMLAQYQETIYDTTYKDQLHIGIINLRHIEDTWFTIHGKTLGDMGLPRFDVGQPDHPGVENCASLFLSGRLNDVNCKTLKLSFICEMNPDT